jgi:hypothetical protein
MVAARLSPKSWGRQVAAADRTSDAIIGR